MSDEPLPPPPDVLAYGEFTLSLRSVLNGKWVVRIAHQARDMVKPAMNESWGVIRAHIDGTIRSSRAGGRGGVRRVRCEREDRRALHSGLHEIRFCHPAIIAQCHDMPLPTLEQEIEFVLAAVRTR